MTCAAWVVAAVLARKRSSLIEAKAPRAARIFQGVLPEVLSAFKRRTAGVLSLSQSSLQDCFKAGLYFGVFCLRESAVDAFTLDGEYFVLEYAEQGRVAGRGRVGGRRCTSWRGGCRWHKAGGCGLTLMNKGWQRTPFKR